MLSKVGQPSDSAIKACICSFPDFCSLLTKNLAMTHYVMCMCMPHG